MKVTYTTHAKFKFELLKKYGFVLTEGDIEKAVKNPDKVENTRKGRKIAQKSISEKHVVRVIYTERDNNIRVIIFYPGRKERYESKL